ncbi:MAG: DUF202 domain-containing protein [Salinisphaera sp.]|jgi:uncharacterized membrane protein YidH (DUF202 family)|nr:DUF202 domain-containing protein [Salinisphaera sp.]
MNWVAPAERAGLQAERTDLSWTRTSLSFAVNGSLLLVRHHVPGPAWLHFGAAGLAALLLVFTLLMARRRRRVLEQRPLPEALADPVPLLMLGGGTLLLGLTTIALLMI